LIKVWLKSRNKITTTVGCFTQRNCVCVNERKIRFLFLQLCSFSGMLAGLLQVNTLALFLASCKLRKKKKKKNEGKIQNKK